jgi:cation:H+ antiporter
MILVGAECIVRNGTALARRLGMSDLMIGITFFAFGTSLPELAIALGAVARNQGDVTLGETYASSIFTGLVVVGLIAVVRPLPVEPLVTQLDLPLLVLSGVILQIFITSARRFVRTEALCMIALYVLFLAAHFVGFRLDLP